MDDPIRCNAINFFFKKKKKSSNEMTWCETKAKIISYKKHPHTFELRSLLFLFRTGTGSHEQPPDRVSEPCKNRSDPTRESNVPELSLSLSRRWIGICYLAGSGWQICFEYIIYPVLCSWFFSFLFFFLLHQPPGQSSPPQAKLCLLGDYLHGSSTLPPLA